VLRQALVALPLIVLPAPAYADAGCGRQSGGWLCNIGAASHTHAAGGGGGGVSAPENDLDVKPMCAPTGGADHCITLPETPRTSTADVVQMARDAIALPAPRPHTSPSRRTWVRLRTFLWLEGSTWQPSTASVSVDGQTVTMTGRPTHVVWSMGEGTVTCQGPGSRNSAACSYRYNRSAPNPYDVTATVYYSVSWTCSGACDTRSGGFDPLPATSHLLLSVGEIQTSATG
jgi:hypothetical protein